MSKRVKIPPFEEVPQFPRDAFLTIEEVAAALRVSVKTIRRLDLPTVYMGKQIPRYCWGQVFDVLKERAA
jgi:hypothetical protein